MNLDVHSGNRIIALKSLSVIEKEEDFTSNNLLIVVIVIIILIWTVALWDMITNDLV